jgi:hypothetical protein
MNRIFLLLMLLWLPVKAVLAAAMPFEALAVPAAPEVMAVDHCAMPDHDAPMPEHKPLSITHCASSLTCHGFCAVFLGVSFGQPETRSIVAPPLDAPAHFYSYIPALLERPPLG